MNLKTNSWYVWLWDYTYSTSLPNNLCPFFWKLILAMILFIPNVILRIPTIVINMTPGNHVEEARTGLGILVYFCILTVMIICYAVYNWVLWLFNAYSYDGHAAFGGGITLIASIAGITAYYYEEKEITLSIKKNIKNNILLNMADAWYNKHCPRITWK